MSQLSSEPQGGMMFDRYVHQPYPKVKHSWLGKARTVQNADEEAALGKGWADTPAVFDPYQGPRQPRTEEQNPLKWVDGWTGAELSSEERNRIKAVFLRADAFFWRSPDDVSAAKAAMGQAFHGVAKVLAEGGILSEEILLNELPALVWDAAIAGGWYRYASEVPMDIFPEQLGHYWIWRDDRDWNDLFYSERTEWYASLVENPPRNAGALSVRVRREAEPASGQREVRPQPQSNAEGQGDGGSALARISHRMV